MVGGGLAMSRRLTALCLAALLGGCSGLEADVGSGGGGGPRDGDAGAFGDAGTGPDSMSEGLPAAPGTPDYRESDDLDPDTSGPGAVDACFVADAEPAPYECDAALLARCPGLRTCCVADGDCCDTASGESFALELDRCDPGDAITCTTLLGIEASAFGDPLPRVQDDALLPNGDDAYDSGLVVGAPRDLTSHRVEVGVTFARPSDCSATCLEGVGVGFSAQQVFDDTTHVRMMVGLLYSGSRDEVSLIIGDEAAKSWELESPEERWSLVVRPTGVLTVTRGDVSHTADFAPSADARLVVYGRNHNRPADSPLGARLKDLAVSSALCDMPTAWPERDQLTFREPGMGAWGASFLHAPSAVVDDSGVSTVALEHDGKLIVARSQEGGSPLDLDLLSSPDVSLLEPPAGATLADPELYVDAGGGTFLFYTVETGAAASIGRAVLVGDAYVPDAEPVIKSDATVVRIEQPTVQRHHSGEWVLIARVTQATGGHELAVYRSMDGVTWTRFDSGHLGPITHRGDVSAVGFDADEIGHPSLIVHNSAWQLYYAGRRGTRWGIGLLVSDELLRWREIGAGNPVFGGDGNGFDRVGAGAPDAVSVGSSVELYYEGSDGARVRLGRAVRQATESGARSF